MRKNLGVDGAAFPRHGWDLTCNAIVVDNLWAVRYLAAKVPVAETLTGV
jgi:hypothetical protein